MTDPRPGTAGVATPEPLPVLSVGALYTEFVTDRGVVRAVDGVSLRVGPGEIVGLVGESGSGKSMTALSILGLVPRPGRVVSGSIALGGRDLLALTDAQMRRVRGNNLALVPQNPMNSLNPAYTIGWQLGEALFAHQQLSRAAAERKTTESLQAVGLPDAVRRLGDFPHRFSGGMRQRVLIAMGLLNGPSLLIADEPTTALDVTIQAQVIDLLRSLSESMGLAILLITHDLGVVASVCHRIAVMYAGEIVEEAPVRELFANPQHPYTRALLRSLPSANELRQRLTAMPGSPPDGIHLDPGCRFRARCPLAEKVCESHPDLLEVGAGHSARCWVAQRDRLAPERPVVPGTATAFPVDRGESRADMVELRHVTKHFVLGAGLFGPQRIVHALDDISLIVKEGETLGVVGESGCGKSTLGRLVAGIYRPTAGEVIVWGTRSVQMIFQDPTSSLDPRMRVGRSISEPLRGGAISNEAGRGRVAELLELVGLTAATADRFPHELSGGQQQRVGIARALAAEPRLLVADEAVSSLDVSLQAQVLNLLKDLQDRLGLTYIFISHDLSVVRFMSTRIAVMYLGKLVELASAASFYQRPLHPYSVALRSAVPIPDPTRAAARDRVILAGDVPSSLAPPSGCRFRTRCPIAQPVCATREPPLVEHAPAHWAACHFAGTFDGALRPGRTA